MPDEPEIPPVEEPPVVSTMIGIEYNAWMSLMSFIVDTIEDIATDYGLANVTIGVNSSYPKDLTKFSKPSIIVQKIGTNKHPFGFGSFLGTCYDENTNTDYDVSAENYDIEFQINVIDSMQTRCQIILSMLQEYVLNRASHRLDGLELTLYDYILNIESPTEIGKMEITHYMDAILLDSNETDDYVGAIRLNISVIRNIVDTGEYIDLSKEIQFTQTIKL